MILSIHHHHLFIHPPFVRAGWCKGEEKGKAAAHGTDRMETVLCAVWYKYKEAREESMANGEPLAHPEVGR